MGQEIMFGDILELWNSIKKKNMTFYFFYFRVDSNRNDKGNDSTNTVLETSPFLETILRILSLSYKTYTLYLCL